MMSTLQRMFAILILISFSAFSNLQAQTIYSTTSGGAWNDTLTWVGHEIPQPNNPVVINGPVSVVANYWTTFCSSLTISLGGSLIEGSASYDDLRIFGPLTNYGTIEGEDLRLRVYGDVMNYGSIDIYHITFYGPTNKNLYSNSMLQIDQLGLADTCDIILLSDIILDSTNCSLGYLSHGLNIGNHNFTLNKGGFSGRIISQDGDLTFTPNTHLSYTTVIGSIGFNGHVKLTGTNYFYGAVTNNGILSNGEYYTDHQYFYDNLINHGTIDDFGGYDFYINLKKDLINTGALLNEQVHFSGNKMHQISSSTALQMTGVI
jgi:hypothetical protein